MNRQTPRQITDHTILAFPDAIKLIREQQREIGFLQDWLQDLLEQKSEREGKWKS